MAHIVLTYNPKLLQSSSSSFTFAWSDGVIYRYRRNLGMTIIIVATVADTPLGRFTREERQTFFEAQVERR
jgi:hypothetical protein